LGSSYVEARYVRERAKGVGYRNGELLSGGQEPSSGIGVRLLVGGSMGFGSFDRMEKQLAEDAVRAAFRMAKNAKRKKKIELGKSVSNRASWSVKAKQPLEDIGVDTMMATAEELNKQMAGLSYYTLMLMPTKIEKYLVTSEGTEITADTSFTRVFVLLTAEGKNGSEQRIKDLTRSGGWEAFKESKLADVVADQVSHLKRAAEEAQKVPELLDQPVDMIVGSEVAGIISHENVGHPSEGDRIMGREGAQAGESFWRDLKIEESRIGSTVVNVSDDPTIPQTSGFYLYDDEGVKARKRRLIKNGIANEPLLNREFGLRFGKESNGAARSSSYNREPIIRMSNTFFEPGDLTFEELIEDVKLGVYMKSFQEWNIDDRRFQSKYTGSEAYLIRNGELTDTMVRRPVLETTSVGLLSAIDGVSKEFVLDFAGTCGKGDPMQGVPVYAGGPHIRIRNVRLGGMG
ncbi:MAG: TldD/PmbA family protein, partial [Candidatus Thorarchaeota archaeon]